MSNNKITSEALGALRVLPDFLPGAAAPREEEVRITVLLSRTSLEFFKAEARRHNMQHQRLIRKLLDRYAEKHSRK
jgi:predicted DNA binding CopG/RHH family protein